MRRFTIFFTYTTNHYLSCATLFSQLAQTPSAAQFGDFVASGLGFSDNYCYHGDRRTPVESNAINGRSTNVVKTRRFELSVQDYAVVAGGECL